MIFSDEAGIFGVCYGLYCVQSRDFMTWVPKSSLRIWKGVSATLYSGRYTLLYPKGRLILPSGQVKLDVLEQGCVSMVCCWWLIWPKLILVVHNHSAPNYSETWYVQCCPVRFRLYNSFCWGMQQPCHGEDADLLQTLLLFYLHLYLAPINPFSAGTV